MDNRFLSDFITDIAQDLISNDPALSHLKQADVSIGYLESEHKLVSKKKAVLGQCEKVPDKYKWSIPFDFLITIFQPNCEMLNDLQMKLLVKHELLHIGIEEGENGLSFSIIPHDIEDFKSIIEEYGLDWAKVPGDPNG